jgi:serine/threonine-protein phosphatase 2A regulatory subunit B'
MGFRKNKTKKNGGKAAAGQQQQATQAQSANSHASQPDSQMTLLTVPMLKDVQVSERPALFARHLSLCQQTFNFMEPSSDLREKERKRQILLSLVDHINGTKDVFNEAIFPDVIAMVSANLFRDLPAKEEKAVEVEDDEPMLEPAWPHLQIVYEFLLRYVVSQDVDAKVAKKYISQSFIIRLLQLFNSEDPRERDYLKTILHRIYGKFMALRAFVRRSINNVFYQVMYEGERHNGIGELLEILGSIINGFALPLKAEHKRFLARALIPLHKVRCLIGFWFVLFVLVVLVCVVFVLFWLCCVVLVCGCGCVVCGIVVSVWFVLL